MRWKILILATLVGVAVLALLLVILRPMGHKLVLKTYFTNAMGLRAGAPVRLAGVGIGSVKSVRARPEVKEAPVEVVMVLSPPYELKVPNDSTVRLETAGVLGETYVEIDAMHASGSPIGPNGVLKAEPTTQLTTEQVIEKLTNILGKKACDCDSKKSAGPDATPDRTTPSKNSSY